MRCDYCPQVVHVTAYRERGGDRVMSLETFKRALSTVPRDVTIMFAGMAEPWLNPAASDMVLHAHAEGYPVDVYTTTSGMTLADVEKIRGVPFLGFCVHVPDRDGRMHLAVTDEYLAVLAACLKAIPDHHFSAIGPVHPRVREVIGRDVNDDAGGLYSRAGLLRAVPKKTGALRCTACGPRLDHNVLLPSGDVALCCMLYDLKHVLGNLVTGTYAGLFEGDEYRRVVRGLAGDESVNLACRTCEVSGPVL